MSIGLQFPCVLFDVEVNLYGDGLAPLEEAALRFLDAQQPPPYFDDLVEFMGIGKWISYAIVKDFWTRGWIVVFPETGQIQVSKAVSKRLDSTELSGFRSTIDPIRLKFLYDLVAGQVAPQLSEHALHEGRGSDAYTYPKVNRHLPTLTKEQKALRWHRYEMNLDGFKAVPQSELTAALQSHPYYKKNLRGENISALTLRVLKPNYDLTEEHIRYYSVFFDVFTGFDDRLVLETSDTRSIQRMLGDGVKDAILPAAERHGPRLLEKLKEAVEARQVKARRIERPLEAFVGLAKTLSVNGGGDAEPLIDAWERAEAYLKDIARSRVDVKRTRAVTGRNQVVGVLHQAVDKSCQQIALSSSRIDPSFFAYRSDDGESSLRDALERYQNRARATDGPKMLLAVTKGGVQPERLASLLQWECDNVAVRLLDSHGPHVGASFAIQDRNALILGNAPLLTNFADGALKIVYRFDPATAPLRTLFRRLSQDLSLHDADSPQLMDVLEHGAVEADRDDAEGAVSASEDVECRDTDLEDMIGEMDRLIDNVSIDRGAEDDSSLSAAVDGSAKRAEWLSQVASMAADLASWVAHESGAAEVLIDAEIFDESMRLVQATPLNLVIALGLSHPRDLSCAPELREALRARAESRAADIHICLPADPKLKADADLLEKEFLDLRNVIVHRGQDQSGWGFGFVLTPLESVLATQGVGNRIVNVGQGRRGTQIGLALHGGALQRIACAAVSTAHPLTEARARLTEKVPWIRQAPPALLTLHAAWRRAKQPEDDGNRGACFVAQHREAIRTLPESILRDPPGWLGDELRFALLKASAAAALGYLEGASDCSDAPSLLAREHQDARELLQYLALVDHVPDSVLARGAVRDLALTWVLGLRYESDPQALMELELSGSDRLIVLALCAALLLDGRGGDLAAIFHALGALPGQRNGRWSALEIALENLVEALVAWAMAKQEAPFFSLSAATTSTPDAFAKIWEDAAAHVRQRRMSATGSLSVQGLRGILFNDPGSFAADFSCLMHDEGPRLSVDDKAQALRQLFGRYDIERSALTADAADLYFDNAHDEDLPARKKPKSEKPLEPVLMQVRDKERMSVRRLFDFAASLLELLDFETEEAQAARRVRRAAALTVRALERARDGELGVFHADIRERLQPEARPKDAYAVPWVLPTAGRALIERDWPALQKAYFEMELPATEAPDAKDWDRQLAREVSRFDALLAVEQSECHVLTMAWDLLSACDVLVASRSPPVALDLAIQALHEKAQRRLRKLWTEQARELRESKLRHGLVSTEFDRLYMDLREDYAAFPTDALAGRALLAREEIKKILSFETDVEKLSELLEDVRQETAKRIEQGAKKKELPKGLRHQIEQLLNGGWIDGAQALLYDNGFSAAFEPLQGGKRRFAQRLGENFSEKGVLDKHLRPAEVDLLRLGAQILAGSADALDGTSVADCLLGFFGVPKDAETRSGETEHYWYLDTSRAELVAIAPFMVRHGEGGESIRIVIPKSEKARQRIIAGMNREKNWRSEFFRPAFAAEDGGEQSDWQTQLGTFSNKATDGGMEHAVPAFVIDGFPSQGRDSFLRITLTQLASLADPSISTEQRRLMCTRFVFDQVGIADLYYWWQQACVAGDGACQSLLARLHARPWPELEGNWNRPERAVPLLARCAELLGVAVQQPETKVHSHPETSNWWALVALTHYSGGNAINAHDLLFRATRTKDGSKLLDLAGTLSRVVRRPTVVKAFRRRLVPETLQPLEDLRGFLDAVEYAELLTEDSCFSPEEFVAQAAEFIEGLDAREVLRAAIATGLIRQEPAGLRLVRTPWLQAASEKVGDNESSGSERTDRHGVGPSN